MASGQPPPRGVLGINYNEQLGWMEDGEMQHMGAQWMRGFIDMHLFNSQHPEQDPNVQVFLRARDAGFKTILSLKWNYLEFDFPSPGHSKHADELQRLGPLLQLVMGKVDILVIGNEPFIEARPGCCDQRLNIFYEALADTVINFRNTHNSSTRLYMGALNRLDLPEKRTPAIERMLQYIASKPELDGVDLHLHMPALAGHANMLEYVLPRIRPDQNFLVTEFSSIWHWKKHMTDTASAEFCTKYGFPPDTKVYQVINAGMKNPMPFAQWKDFLMNEPWYMERRGFIANAVKLYRSTGRLDVATYCMCPMRMRKRPMQPGDNPWMLNGLYAPSTVQLKPDRTRHLNFPWGEQYRRIQRGET